METSQEILVVILSGALAVFLILSIILLAICIKIANHVKRITEKAELITDKAEDIADFFSKAATPLVIGKIIGKVTDAFRTRPSKRRK